MARGADNQSFADIIASAATQIPDDTGEGARADVPTLFSFPVPAGEHVVEDEPVPDSKRINGIPAYNYSSHFRRFIIGEVVSGMGEDTQRQFYDDTEAYEEVQNEVLAGKAILCWEKTQFLRDGGFIIAMKWLTPKEKSKLATAREDDNDDDSSFI